MTSRRAVPTLIGVIVSLALLSAACGDDDTTESASTTAETTEPITSAPDEPGPTPEGSGCAPGPGPLPDGRWYGVVESTSDAELSFDLACWYIGDDAVAASAEDGEESPPPNDYYVRNDDPATREVAVAEGVTVEWYPTGDPTGAETVPYGEWIDARTARGSQLAVWVDVEDGAITSIEEQWVP